MTPRWKRSPSSSLDEGGSPGSGASPPPRTSLVIPARNEERWLPPLLASVDAARERYHAGPDAVEVIVADNASTDRTAEIARRHGCRVAWTEKRVIAAVRNTGARMASGKLLCFVDADSRIHPETFNVVDRALEDRDIVAGSTGVKPDRMSFGLAFTMSVFLPVVWLTRMDSGVVFCRRADYQAVGGYNEKRRVAEDVQFLWDLRRLGRERGQRLKRLTSARALTSTRKFEHYGEWHYVTALLRSVYWYRYSRPKFEAYVDEYWYGDHR